MCDQFYYPGQWAATGDVISVSGGWLLLCKEPIVAEGRRSPHNYAAGNILVYVALVFMLE